MSTNGLREKMADMERQLEMQRLLADCSSEGIGVFDKDTRCVAANRAAVEMLGYTVDELLCMKVLDFIDEESRADVVNNFRRGVTEPYVVRARRKNGDTFPAEVQGRNVSFNGDNYRVTAMRDISEIKATQAELQATLYELEIIFTNSKVGLMFLRGGRILKRANQTLADILGYATPEEMSGISMRKLHLTEERFEEFGKKYFSSLSDGAKLNIEYQLRKKDGTALWCSLSGQAVDRNKPADVNKGVLWVVDDISERKVYEEQLVKLATTDDLTGALNRNEFLNQVERIEAGDKRTPVGPSVLMVDLDHFKTVNDEYGHEVGDEVLRSFASICRGVLRNRDLLARMGGEEFAIYLPGTDLGGAIAVAERLRVRFASHDTLTPKGRLRCTASIGVAATSSRVLAFDDLLRRADASMYEAKRDGRNRVAFYD